MNLDADTARAAFAATRVARLATADAAGRPHLVPVTFAVQRVAGADLVHIAVDAKPKRSTDLKRLRNIAANPAVALLADRYDDDWSALWWVRADGTAVVTTDEAARRVPVELLTARYPQYVATPPQGPVITVTVARWSGWSYAGTGTSDGGTGGASPAV